MPQRSSVASSLGRLPSKPARLIPACCCCMPRALCPALPNPSVSWQLRCCFDPMLQFTEPSSFSALLHTPLLQALCPPSWSSPIRMQPSTCCAPRVRTGVAACCMLVAAPAVMAWAMLRCSSSRARAVRPAWATRGFRCCCRALLLLEWLGWQSSGSGAVLYGAASSRAAAAHTRTALPAPAHCCWLTTGPPPAHRPACVVCRQP